MSPALCHRESRAGFRHRRAGCGIGCPVLSRRRLQAPHFAYAFQGLGVEACASWRDSRALRPAIVTEAIDNETLDLVAEWADVIQIGARNMQNFSLLKHAGRLRSGAAQARLSATLDEFLMAAEYIMSEATTRSSCASAAYAPLLTTAQHPRPQHCSRCAAPQPPAHPGRPQHGTVSATRCCPWPRCHCLRCRRYPGRGAPSTRKSALRRPQSIYPDQFAA